jgi:hypothetical protein
MEKNICKDSSNPVVMNQESVEEKLNTLIEINRQHLQWMKILALDQARDVVNESLESPAEYHLYENLDGESSIGDIVDEVPIPRRTVYTRLNDWQQVGIVSKVGRGKYEKLAPLADLGIDLPDLEEEE